MTRKAIKIGNRRLSLVMALIAFHSVSEHHFIEMQYNALFAIPFFSYALPPVESSEEGLKDKKQLVIATIITATVTVFSAYVLGPSLLSWIKTFYEIKGLVGGKTYAPWVIIGNLLIILILDSRNT